MDWHLPDTPQVFKKFYLSGTTNREIRGRESKLFSNLIGRWWQRICHGAEEWNLTTKGRKKLSTQWTLFRTTCIQGAILDTQDKNLDWSLMRPLIHLWRNSNPQRECHFTSPGDHAIDALIFCSSSRHTQTKFVTHLSLTGNNKVKGGSKHLMSS